MKKNFIENEFIVTNGIGGYASSTLSGCNTRKYHGLLVASLNPPVDRQVIVSKTEEYIVREDGSFIHTATNQYADCLYPEGYQLMTKFSRKPFPLMEFEAEGYAFGKQLFMPYGSNTTIVEYFNFGLTPITLNIHPLWVFRNHHTVQKEDSFFNFYFDFKHDGIILYPHFNSIPVYWKFSKGTFTKDQNWYKGAVYSHEIDRGFDGVEDRHQIGFVTVTLQPGESCYHTYTTEDSMMYEDPAALKYKEELRLKQLVPSYVVNEFLQDLIVAGDQFVVKRNSTHSTTILAGYHWFTDWGRDTMISMLGLTISLQKKEESASIIKTFINYVSEGMLPNRFPDKDEDEPEYNTIDGTLWLFVALYEYYNQFQDNHLIKQVYPVLTSIIAYHIRGTRYGIHVTDKGFLRGGDENTQLTWMDAKIGDHTVTPRNGSPVEINALWYNALSIYEYFSAHLHMTPDESYIQIKENCKNNFKNHFVNKLGYLNDIYNDDGSVDESIRPNQLYVLSLPFSLIDDEDLQKSILEITKEELFTPLGLRTLSPRDEKFRATYEGDGWSRDTAYHQGTTWPFLISEYMIALLKTNNYSDDAKQECWRIVQGYANHFYNNAGIHCISEIADGLTPYEGKGCIHQAWSISALIRTLSNASMLHWW